MFERPDTRFHETHSSSSTATITIKNGIYSFKAKALDGVEGAIVAPLSCATARSASLSFANRPNFLGGPIPFGAIIFRISGGSDATTWTCFGGGLGRC